MKKICHHGENSQNKIEEYSLHKQKMGAESQIFYFRFNITNFCLEKGFFTEWFAPFRLKPIKQNSLILQIRIELLHCVFGRL